MTNLNQIPYDYTVEVMNRFKGLDLVDRVSEELWMEVCNTVKEEVTKFIPGKKKCKKAEKLSEEALQKQLRKEEKQKAGGKSERYTQLNAKFQRIARRDKKAFLSKLCTEDHDILQQAVIKTIPKKRNAKTQNGCLRRAYKELRKEEKLKAKEKRKATICD